MDISAAQFSLQLLATCRASQTKTTGAVNVGQPTTTVDLSDLVDVVYAARVQLGKGGVGTWNPVAGTIVTAAAGTSQVETATAAGTASGNGIVAVTIVSAAYSAANKTVNVSILSGDTASAWATKVRAALTADADVNAAFAVSGAGADIILTDRLKNANDATLNIALANGSPDPGITPAATSANTTAGVASVVVTDADGKDWEGVTLGTPVGAYGLAILCAGGSATIDNTADSGNTKSTLDYVTGTAVDYFFQGNGGGLHDAVWNHDYVITALSTSTDVTVILFGSTT